MPQTMTQNVMAMNRYDPRLCRMLSNSFDPCWVTIRKGTSDPPFQKRIEGHLLRLSRVKGSLGHMPDIEGAGVRVANVSYPTTAIAQFFQISNVARLTQVASHEHTRAVLHSYAHVQIHCIRRNAELHPWGHTQIRHG